ncbi:hypothetical protein U1Q18_017732, partial [Sarracenia purpurea var. burkii]
TQKLNEAGEMIPRRLHQISQETTINQTHQQTQSSHQKHPNPNLSIPISIQQTGFCPTKSAPSPSNWSHRIRYCISRGDHREALLFYSRTRRTGIYHLGALPLLLKACASLSLLNHGKALHAESVKVGIESGVMVGTSLVDMYGKCGDIVGSRKVFDNVSERNVVTWNAMIGGYMATDDTKSASVLFEQMSTRSAVTWIEMIDGFGRRGDTVTARQLFDQVPLEMRTVVTWTVMVDGYCRNGEMGAAREVFEKMPIRNFFVWSSMISGYCKTGDVQAAKDIFERIPERNLVNWNSIISGLAQNGFFEEALDDFRKMRSEGFEPNEVTMAGVLSACAQLGLLDAGKEIHQMIVHKRIKLNQFLLNGLIDMYGKCGDLSNARLIFEKISNRNDACWNSMISSYAIHGQCQEALELFGKMEQSTEKPNDITFLSVLSACAHGGSVEEGLETFSKIKKHGLTARIKHYGCLIDLLGRAGRIREAYDLIKMMPMKPNDTVWGALLGACRIYSDTDMADRVLEEIGRDSEPGSSYDSQNYVTLSNIYAASDSWERAQRMRTVMLIKGFQKAPGHSSFMLNSPETSFSAAIA